MTPSRLFIAHEALDVWVADGRAEIDAEGLVDHETSRRFALTEAVRFTEEDGTVAETTHTARFGEIEERFYACTPTGRALYDTCLAEADAGREKDPSLPKRDMAAYEAAYRAPFAPFAKTLPGLIGQGYVYARYAPTAQGIAAANAGRALPTDLMKLVELGFICLKQESKSRMPS